MSTPTSFCYRDVLLCYENALKNATKGGGSSWIFEDAEMCLNVTCGYLQCRCLARRVGHVDGERQSKGASQLPVLTEKAFRAAPTEGSVVNISTAPCTAADNKTLRPNSCESVCGVYVCASHEQPCFY